MRASISLLILHVVFILISPANSQQLYENLSSDMISQSALIKHVTYLAGDCLEGRGTGTQGHELAEEYVGSFFQNHNIKKICLYENGTESYFQKVTIQKFIADEQTKATISNSEDQTFKLGDNFILFHFGNLEHETVEGEVVLIGDGIYEPDFQIDNYEHISIENKWVLMNESISEKSLKMLPEQLQSEYRDGHISSLIRSEVAAEKGALGVLFAPSEMGLKYWNIRDQSFREYYALPDSKSPYRSSKVPVLLIDSLLFTSIISSSSPCELVLDKRINLMDTIISNNVIGMVRGSQIMNDTCIILGAHLDHEGIKKGEIYNGADDDASGVAALLEISKAISGMPCHHNIIFIAFTAEEIGVLGSYYFINSPIPKEFKIQSMINLDMIGRLDGDANELALISPNIEESDLKEMIDISGSDCDKIDWGYMKSFGRKYSGDHFPFTQKNIPSLMILSGFHSDYHQTTDDSDKIDSAFLFGNTSFAYRLLRTMGRE